MSRQVIQLITEKANHSALKAVLAAHLRRNPTFEVVIGSGPPILHGFEVPLFEPNEMVAAVWGEPTTFHDDEVMEWESTVLAPALEPFLTKGERVEQAVEAMAEVMSKVDGLAKDSPVRVVLWCAVLPAISVEGILAAEHRERLRRLVDWFAEEIPESVIAEVFAKLHAQDAGDFLRVPRTCVVSPLLTKTFYVTTPIYYVNAAPHIGHVYSTLIADALARYHDVKGERTFFCTGTDEHGLKVAQAAQKLGQQPIQFTTAVSQEFRQCFEAMRFRHDYFIRTTDETHVNVVQALWRELRARGDIYLGKYEGWYCVSDEAYVTSQNLTDGFDREGRPCKVTVDSNNPCIWVTEDNYMFRLSQYKDRLLEWYHANPTCVVPAFRRLEVIRFVESGLIDLSVSRNKDACSWGIPVPDDDRHVVYVWLDALSNYFTASRVVDGRIVDFPALERWPADVHVIGKDILKFHAIYWPAFLMAAGLPLPKKIVAHGWWTKDKQKISKSLGNVFDPLEKAQRFGLDALRYFCLREASFSDDGDYSDVNMTLRLNNELADTLGNLLMRCVSRKLNTEGVWPSPGDYQPEDTAVIRQVTRLPALVDHYFSVPDIQRAIGAVFDVLRSLNVYTTDAQPWKLAKERSPRLATVLYVILEGLRICVTLLQPIIPHTAPKMLTQLGVAEKYWRGVEAWRFGSVPPGTSLGEPSTEILFVKVQVE